MVVSGHTHHAYNCTLPNAAARHIPVTSASSFGRLVTDIDMTINRASDQPTPISVNNVIVTRTVPRIRRRRRSSTSTTRPSRRSPTRSSARSARTSRGRTTRPASRHWVTSSATRSSAYTQSAGSPVRVHEPGRHPGRVSSTLPSGGEAAGTGDVRRGLHRPAVQQPRRHPEPDRRADQEHARAVVHAAASAGPRRRSSSRCRPSFTTATTRPVPAAAGSPSITSTASPIDPAATYTVAMNNFLADGGDSFPGFKAGTDRVYAPGFDVDALTAYLGAHSPVAPGPQNRITTP